MQCWIRNQVTVLSGKLKMSAKRAMVGYFTLKYRKLDKRWGGFHSRETKVNTSFLIWNEKTFAELSKIVFQYVGSKESDW